MSAAEQTVRDEMVVTLEFELYTVDGDLVESTEGDEPLLLIQGRGHIIPGLEQALYGMHVGDEKELTLPPEQAFGEYDDDAVYWLPVDAFDDDMKIEIGVDVDVVDEESGDVMVATITAVENSEIQIDFNHPLAGETLVCRIKVVGLRRATSEELEHDHVHDLTNGHHH